MPQMEIALLVPVFFACISFSVGRKVSLRYTENPENGVTALLRLPGGEEGRA